MEKKIHQKIRNALMSWDGHHGAFIDAYNQNTNNSISGTITTRIDASRMWFVIVNAKNKTLKMESKL